MISSSFDKSLKLQNEVFELALAVNSSIFSIKVQFLTHSLSLLLKKTNFAFDVRHHLLSLGDNEESWNINGVRRLAVTRFSDSLGRLVSSLGPPTLSLTFTENLYVVPLARFVMLTPISVQRNE